MENEDKMHKELIKNIAEDVEVVCIRLSHIPLCVGLKTQFPDL